MINVIDTLNQFNLPSTILEFVRITSDRAQADQAFIPALADAFLLDLTNVAPHAHLTFVQYAILELIKNDQLPHEEAVRIALGRTEAMFSKHPYLQPRKKSDDNEQPEKRERRRSSDKKQQALELYNANKDNMSLAELVNLIADKLEITKANARYYTTRCFGHQASE